MLVLKPTLSAKIWKLGSVKMVRVLVTGANGFIGKSLTTALLQDKYKVETFSRNQDPKLITELVAKCDAVVHLAGENRPKVRRNLISQT